MAEGLDVGNLSWNSTEETLSEHMSAAGPVAGVRVLRYPDGRSKGAAIVTFAAPDSVSRAIAELTDTTLDGRQVFVREDREASSGAGRERPAREPRAPRGDRPAREPRAPRGDRVPGTSVFVGNLAWGTDWRGLKDAFADYGCVYSDVKSYPDGRSKGWGIVRFDTVENASRAIAEMNDAEIDGRRILVREDREA